MGVRIVLRPRTGTVRSTSETEHSRLEASDTDEEIIVQQAIDGSTALVPPPVRSRRSPKQLEQHHSGSSEVNYGFLANGMPAGPFMPTSNTVQGRSTKNSCHPAVRPGTDFDSVRVLSDSRTAAALVEGEHHFSSMFSKHAHEVASSETVHARPRRWYHRGSPFLLPPEPSTA